MRELTASTPKPMLCLLGRPMLAWKIEMLPEAIDEVILVVGYLQEQIRNYFGEEWQGRKIRYVVQEELNGSGGAISLTKELLVGTALVMNGDDLYHHDDLSLLIREEWAVLGLYVDEAEPYGLLETDASGYLRQITERPHGKKTGTINTGAYMLQPHFFRYPLVEISATEYGLPQTLVTMAQDYPVKVQVARAWQPVGRPEDIALGEMFLRKNWRVKLA